MRLSIRARLTLWYCSIVVAVLVTGAVAGSFAQSRLSLQRLDDDLVRAMATLQGVMRTEFSEGLTLEASAEEASIEVVVPDRTLILARPDGAVLHVWGLPLPQGFLPAIGAQPATVTLDTPSGGVRMLSQEVEYAAHRYRAAVLAPLEPLLAQHVEMVRAMSMGVALALIVAAAGGWLIGRQTLRPLTMMAAQARGIDERNPGERLMAPPVDDELGRLATSFNGLLGRLAAALNGQRQFMADASHQLRTPVSIVRTATQVTLARDSRTEDEYRQALTIIGEQGGRLSRLVDDMFLLSRAEAQGVPLRREFLHFDDVVADSARAVRVLADQRRVTVTVAGADELGLAGDDALLRQMVGNLLDNAIRHACPGGEVRLQLERAGRHVLLRLTNDGPDIATADRQRIFERFVRAGESSWRRAGPAHREMDRRGAWRHAGAGGQPARRDDLRGHASQRSGGRRNRQPFRRPQIDSSVDIAGRAYRRYRDGTMNRLRIVDVTSPPRITTASGCSIS